MPVVAQHAIPVMPVIEQVMMAQTVPLLSWSHRPGSVRTGTA
ncbi:MAG: hypothetical protein P4L90_15580 [Rhodopila sp.]|nr:hypothetical protein [Rhodopila sp.]